MLVLLSPSKTQNFSDNLNCGISSKPALLKDSKVLVETLRRMSETKLSKALGISAKLAALNFERYQNFSTPFTLKNSRQALLAFRGDVYRGFHLDQYKKADYQFAQKHLRILSGLYGVLQPLDLIQPYRLEMKTRLATRRGTSLYDFWGSKITELLNADLPKTGSGTVVNLASKEYFQSVAAGELNGSVVTPVFKEKKGGQYKTIALFAKRARGDMANFIVQNRIKKAVQLKDFDADGYSFHPPLSSENTLTFVRNQG